MTRGGGVGGGRVGSARATEPSRQAISVPVLVSRSFFPRVREPSVWWLLQRKADERRRLTPSAMSSSRARTTPGLIPVNRTGCAVGSNPFSVTGALALVTGAGG